MKLSANKILSINEPGELFSDNINVIKEEYIELAKQWHPDLHCNSKESTDVMARINELYQQNIDLINSGKWHKPGVIKLTGKDKKVYEVKYKIKHDFELGSMYIADNVVLYLVKKDFKNLFDNAQTIINGFTFANENMETEVSKYLPKIIAKFETKDNEYALVIKKTPDLFLLKDVLSFYNRKIPPEHVAWILSSLYNLTCYFEYNKLAQNSILLDTYFISPKFHSGSLLGGWWYGVPQESKMIGVTEKIYSIMPPDIKTNKKSNIQTDLESIRLIGRELLGDENGTKLSDSGIIPKPIIEWLRGVSSKSALEDYSKWNKVLKDSFGERRFIEMKIDTNELYKKINNK